MTYNVDDNSDVSTGPFPAGMNTRQPDHALPDGTLRNAVNIDVDVLGLLSRRDGYGKIFSGLDVHSGFSCPLWTLFVDSGVLKRLNGDNTATAITPVRGEVCYCFLNGIVYFSDGVTASKLLPNGSVVQWGAAPLTVPVLSQTTGALAAGVYLAAITQVGFDGIEHGSSSVVQLTVTDGSGITFQLPAVLDPQITYVRLYLSPENGSKLFAVVDVPAGTTTHNVTAPGKGRELGTLGVTGAPPCTAIEEYGGRLFMKSGMMVWYTDPLAYDWVRPASNFLMFAEDVSVIAATQNVLWIAADKTYMYRGSDPAKFSVEVAAEYGAVPGKAAKVPNSNDVVWYSTRGLVRAGDTMKNLQETHVAAESGDKVAVIVKERDGLQQAVASVQNAVLSPLVSQSFLEMEVTRKAA